MKTLIMLASLVLPASSFQVATAPSRPLPVKRISQAIPSFLAEPPNLLAQTPTWLVTSQTTAPVRSVDVAFNSLAKGILSQIAVLCPSPGIEPHYVAAGGSLTAGFRNGGLYREAQLTAYPNLLARQMGLADFRQPLFEVAQGNGTGYKRMLGNSAFPTYEAVTNELAIKGTDPFTLTPFVGRADNLGFPLLGIHTAQTAETWRFDKRTGPGLPYEPAYRPYFRRVLPEDGQQWAAGYVPFVLAQKPDFITIELGMDDAIWFATAGGYGLTSVMTLLASGESSPVVTLLNDLRLRKAKGAIATVPDVLAFPYFQFYNRKAVRQRIGDRKLFAIVDDRYAIADEKAPYVAEVTDADILLPSANIDALLTTRGAAKGLSVDNPLSSHDVLSAHEIAMMKHVEDLNGLIRFQANQASIPVVDLRDVYKRVLSGQFVTDDGVKIDPSFPTGNFFSSDGLNLSALGQAVIANEWIKTINQFYKTQIPLIGIADFNAKIGK